MQFRSPWIEEDQSVPLRGKLLDWYLRKPLSQTLRAVYTRLMSVYYWIICDNVFRKQSFSKHRQVYGDDPGLQETQRWKLHTHLLQDEE